MNVHITNRANRSTEVENEINQQITKLTRRMRVFRPELVHLHVDLAPGSSKRNGGLSANLNLRMPSGQIHAASAAQQGIAAIKDAFRDLTTQLDAHKEHLRNRRNFRRNTAQQHGVPFETTVASVKAPEPNPEASTGDIRLYLNTNIDDLERFVRRQLRLRIGASEISANLVSVEEVLDETVANALDEHAQHPDLLSIEQWLYRLAMQAVDIVAERNRSIGDVHIEEPRGEQNVSGSDENYLQYHQPDDQLFVEDFIPDQTRSNPEQIVYSRESIDQVGGALACLNAQDRDAFVLYALEGFSVPEIAHIAQRTEQQVHDSLHNARATLNKQLSPDNAYRQLLNNEARSA
ncbi:MAG: sigma-70 family RNA polymerase sigma factor [Acidobacteriales bacterium]|nr:sigma-70 family RNA polymerase sigma factor [Terriglobales bacterium]